MRTLVLSLLLMSITGGGASHFLVHHAACAAVDSQYDNCPENEIHKIK